MWMGGRALDERQRQRMMKQMRYFAEKTRMKMAEVHFSCPTLWVKGVTCAGLNWIGQGILRAAADFLCTAAHEVH